MTIITISRQEGSGGAELAERLAKVLDYRLVDKDILVRVAALAHVPVEEVEAFEQRTGSLVERYLHSLARGLPDMDDYFRTLASMPGAATQPVQHYLFYGHREGPADFGELKPSDGLKYFEAAIRELAERGRAIIVGRGGQVLLADFPHALHLRVVATEPYRAAAVARERQTDVHNALKIVRDLDQHRVDYVKVNYGRDVNDPLLYDAVLRIDHLNLDEAVDFVHRWTTAEAKTHESHIQAE